jgi:hypothetical protein
MLLFASSSCKRSDTGNEARSIVIAKADFQELMERHPAMSKHRASTMAASQYDRHQRALERKAGYERQLEILHAKLDVAVHGGSPEAADQLRMEVVSMEYLIEHAQIGVSLDKDAAPPEPEARHGWYVARDDVEAAAGWYLQHSKIDLILDTKDLKNLKSYQVNGSITDVPDVTDDLSEIIEDETKRSTPSDRKGHQLRVGVADFDAIEHPRWREFLAARDAVESANRKQRQKEARRERLLWEIPQAEKLQQSFENEDPGSNAALGMAERVKRLTAERADLEQTPPDDPVQQFERLRQMNGDL